MANKHKQENSEQPQREAGRKDSGAGHTHATGVDGIGGAGGSSGSGSVRAANPHNVGDISGIDAQLDENEVPAPGSTGKGGPAEDRQTESRDGGLPGKTRGADSETVPSQSGGS